MSEPKEFKSFYKEVGGNEGNKCHYPTRLDTYGCGCQHDCSYCLDPDTLILMYDGSAKKLRDVQIGDEIYGVEFDGKYNRYVKSIVTNKWTTNKPSYKITLQNGTTVIASADHRFLTERGWKYVIGAQQGKDKRPHLTTNQHINGLNYPFMETPKETESYKRGYLAGVIIGDGNLTKYDYSNKRETKGKDKQYHFRLAMKYNDAIIRVKQYLLDFGISTNDFTFDMIDRRTKETIHTKAIRNHKREDWYKIKDIIYNSEKNSEYYRGYLAGNYDAEGYTRPLIRRTWNTEDSVIQDIIDGLNLFNFKYTIEIKGEKTVNNKTVKCIRLYGGVNEFFRFLQLCNPAMKNKWNYENVVVKVPDVEQRKIISIEKYKEEQELIDISTTTENFIANGLISHNCYAKSLLDFRNLWNPEEPSVANIKKIENKLKKIPQGTILRLGGMTDCFQPCELQYKNTYKTIELLNKYNIGYLIVTKSHIVGNDEYINLMRKDLAHIQITVTTLDDDLSLQYEKASIPSKRIEAIKKLQDAGFDVAIRLSPIIEPYMDFDKLNSLGIDKAIVEFLRVNSWIQKWFDIDYSKYTLKQSNYKHLPLEEKQRILEKIKIPTISICEDYDEHYEYWKENINPNKDDCCNLNKY